MGSPLSVNQTHGQLDEISTGPQQMRISHDDAHALVVKSTSAPDDSGSSCAALRAVLMPSGWVSKRAAIHRQLTCKRSWDIICARVEEILPRCLLPTTRPPIERICAVDFPNPLR